MRTSLFSLFVAVVFHLGLILFGKLLFVGLRHDGPAPVTVELESEMGSVAKTDPAKPDPAKQPEPKPDEDTEKDEEVDISKEPPPDTAELMRDLEPAAGKLEAASLSAIEDALRGNAPGGGEFAEALNLASGGRIGGTGTVAESGPQQAFGLAEIDEKPRVIFQAPPVYPAEMRTRRVDGFVQVAFVVDTSGRVTDVRAEKCSDPAFEKPALEAVRRWRFDPAVKGGQRVQCRMRVPIRFEPT